MYPDYFFSCDYAGTFHKLCKYCGEKKEQIVSNVRFIDYN